MMSEWYAWDYIPIVAGIFMGLGVLAFLILALLGRGMIRKDTGAICAHVDSKHKDLVENVEDLEKKVDELRLQVGILNHGARVIHMPPVAADIVERRKPGPKPGSRKKPKEIE